MVDLILRNDPTQPTKIMILLNFYPVFHYFPFLLLYAHTMRVWFKIKFHTNENKMILDEK